MTCRIRLALVIHNHQPIGNFDGVFEAAHRDSYSPFLDVLEEYPEVVVSLHVSGSLLEWLAAHCPEYVERLRGLSRRGQVEILGGAFYEPILAAIPRRDRIGQIAAYSRYLEKTFGANVRGMWVPERVWEQTFAGDIARAGIEYTILDDFHFRTAGLQDDQLYGYYITEDEGRLLKVFPGSERLRYTIPFADPQETIDYLGHIADSYPNPVVAFGDDGEKFGTWPGTHKHVYDDGWLRRFFDALRDNGDWIKVATLAECVDDVAPVGTVYLPDSSYREMTEWALPTSRQMEYVELAKRKESDPDWELLKQFVRGGFWRNFRVKYPESQEMYARVVEISDRLQDLEETGAPRTHPDAIAAARTELYRAECNCSYWHGAFGGIYLPHLRNAVYKHLIAADSALETASDRPGRWVQIDAGDYNLDARKEIRLSGDRLVAYLAPTRGGHLYELDIRQIRHNLLATLNRREEPYHQTVREAAQQQHHSQDNGGIASIHEAIRFKQPNLDQHLIYDPWPRKSLIDHFLQPGLTLETFQTGIGELGDFVGGVYQTRVRRSSGRVEAHLSRDGAVGPYRPRLTKIVSLDINRGGQLEIRYELENLPAGLPFHFGIEFNFAGMAAAAPDRYYYDARGQQLGQLESVHDLKGASRIGLTDEWLGLDASLEVSQPGGIWALPIQTISQSEGGFELVHQSCAVVPHWEFEVPKDGRFRVDVLLSVDTSAAQARQLRSVEATTPAG